MSELQESKRIVVNIDCLERREQFACELLLDGYTVRYETIEVWKSFGKGESHFVIAEKEIKNDE